MGNIRLSEKHGLNPSLGICFWCGGDNGQVIIPGRLPGDAAAPHRGVWNYDPCSGCLKHWDSGVLMVEVTPTPNFQNQPEMAEGHYPTSRWCVLREEAYQRMFGTPHKSKRAFVDRELMERFLNAKPKGEST